MIENRFQSMQEKSSYNPRIINSASKLSACIQREQSKVVLALPTNNKQVEFFEKAVAGGFSSVNNRLSFVYSLKLDGESKPKKRRVISKIIKLDENNQYEFAMTKPMPTGCIKEYPCPSWLKFNVLLEKVSPDDPIGHLFIVDIEFDEKNATQRELLYNEIFPPIIGKKKVLDADERSTFQLLDMFDRTTEDKPKSCRCTLKSRATIFPKNFIPLYLEDLRFLIKRVGWRVTKLYSQILFEQDAF